jgi:hypothetical protein
MEMQEAFAARPRPSLPRFIPLRGMGKGRNIMKFARLTRVLVPLLVLALTATAFAAGGATTIKLFSAAQLNGKSLPAGEYKVKWDSHSPEAEVTFLQGKTAVATARAKLVDRDQASREDAVVTRANSDGSETIIEIRVEGKKSVLVFE